MEQTRPSPLITHKAVQAVFGTPADTNVLGSGPIMPSPQAPLYLFATAVRIAAAPSNQQGITFSHGMEA